MRAVLQVLSQDDLDQVHERTLAILAETGVRVDTALGRQLLGDAGAAVDENSRVVRFPRSLVEEALQLVPRSFTLGARRPGWDLQMNAGACALLVDGEATSILDRQTGERRPSTHADWIEATRFVDALDEIGVYWSMIERCDTGSTMADYVQYLRSLFGNFSKHVQDVTADPEQAPWLLEVLQVIFGDKERIRQEHPLSFLLCPQSPLVLEGPYTDAYLALTGWNIPVAVMPMPIMGATAPGSLISTVVLGNCEVLATLCLVQAAEPGTPFIYAPALVVMDPRSGRYSGGAIENGLLNTAAVEMARYYGLPVEASGLSTDHYVPGIQAAYERAMNALLPLLAWPDILVGPGSLGGSMVFSFEQTLIDVEIFRMARQAHRGIDTHEERWLDEVVSDVGHGGHFLGERSTVKTLRQGEWYISDFGSHGTFEQWEADGKPALRDQARSRVEQILLEHRPLPLSREMEQELGRIQKRAQSVE
jgi:trimethylamine--corrinoid protein Co-methyltransferase